MADRRCTLLGAAVWLCVLLRLGTVLVEGVALLLFGVLEHAVDIYAHTGRMLDVPRALSTAHLWFDANLSEVVFWLGLAFWLGFAVVLMLLLAVYRRLGLRITIWMPLIATLPVPYANLLLPWTGLFALRLGVASRARPLALNTVAGSTIVFALVFVGKLLVDAIWGSTDIQTNLLHAATKNIYLDYAEELALKWVDLVSSALFLVAFALHWRAFLRDIAKARGAHIQRVF